MWTESLRIAKEKKAVNKAAAKGQTNVQVKSH